MSSTVTEVQRSLHDVAVLVGAFFKLVKTTVGGEAAPSLAAQNDTKEAMRTLLTAEEKLRGSAWQLATQRRFERRVQEQEMLLDQRDKALRDLAHSLASASDVLDAAMKRAEPFVKSTAVPVTVDELIAYAYQVTPTTTGPLGLGAPLGRHTRPAPTTQPLQQSRLFQPLPPAFAAQLNGAVISRHELDAEGGSIVGGGIDSFAGEEEWRAASTSTPALTDFGVAAATDGLSFSLKLADTSGAGASGAGLPPMKRPREEDEDDDDLDFDISLSAPPAKR